MATVNVVFAAGGARGTFGSLDVYRGVPASAENITSSGTSAVSTNAATTGSIARITASGGAVYAKVGSAPTATVGGDWLIPDGASLDLAIPVGYKIAVIDAA